MLQQDHYNIRIYILYRLGTLKLTELKRSGKYLSINNVANINYFCLGSTA